MNVLDRYIARMYLTNTLVLFTVIFCFVVAIDVSINMERFSDAAAELAGESAGGVRKSLLTVILIADLWWPRLLNLFNVLLGVMLVTAMGFTSSQLVRNRELVAVLASGQSLFRVGRPMLVVALGFSVLQLANRELVIPRIAPLVLRDHGEAGQRNLAATRVPLVADSAGNRFYASTFDPDAGVMTDVTVWLFENGSPNPRSKLSADTATWNGSAWVFDPPAAAESRIDRRERLEPVAELASDLDPTALRVQRYEGYGESLSWSQASAMIGVLERSGADNAETRRRIDQLDRVRFGRVAGALSNLLALAICMPFFVTRLPQNMVIQSLKCAPVAVIALAGSAVGSAIAIPGLPAEIGVFLPVLILLPAAIATLTSVRT